MSVSKDVRERPIEPPNRVSPCQSRLVVGTLP